MRLERGNLSKVGISQGYRSSPPLVSINFAISATLGDILRRGAMTRRHIRLIASLSLTAKQAAHTSSHSGRVAPGACVVDPTAGGSDSCSISVKGT